MKWLLAITCAGCISKPSPPTGDYAWRELPLQMGTDAPPRMVYSRLTYDQQLEKIVLFGGFRPDFGKTIPEMWSFDGNLWTPECGADGGDPCMNKAQVRSGFVGTEDRLLSFGGTTDEGQTLSSALYEDRGDGWKPVTTTGGPGEADLATLVEFRGAVYEVGGYADSNALSDIYRLDGTTWTSIAMTNMAAFANSGNSVITADDDAILAWDDNSNGTSDDMWQFDGKDWLPVCRVMDSNPCSGTRRRDATLLHIGGVATFLLGGYDDNIVPIAGTMILDGDHFKTYTADGPARAQAGAAYDPKRDIGVLFGGDCAANAEDQCDTTWVFARQ
ncbi:MAG: hypothetical protein QM831_19890 [Kofleriaceae bacterium]